MARRTIHPRRGSASLAVLLAAAVTGAWPADAASLRDALMAAYETNPDLEAQRAGLRATDELIPQALSAYRPQAFLNGTLRGTRGDVGTGEDNSDGGSSFGGGTLGGSSSQTNRGRGGSRAPIKQTEQTIGLSITQNLYQGGARTAALSRARNLVQAGRATLIAQEQDTLLSAVDAYTAAWRDLSILNEALNNEQRLGRQLEATRDRFEVGEVARTDVAQAEARLAGARADVETAKASLSASNAQYRQVIGQPPADLVDPGPLRQLPPTLAEAQAIAAGNPLITEASFNLRAADDDITVSRANLLPSLDLQADAEYSDQPSFSTPWQQTAALGLQLSIPLYQGGAEYSQIRQGRETMKQRQKQVESANRAVQEQVAADWDNLLASKASVDQFRSETRANRIALDGVEQEALVGSRTVLDVLDAQQELFTSQVNLVRAQREVAIASYQLKSSIGQLTVADLDLDVTRYDPEAYLERNRNRLFGIDGSALSDLVP